MPLKLPQSAAARAFRPAALVAATLLVAGSALAQPAARPPGPPGPPPRPAPPAAPSIEEAAGAATVTVLKGPQAVGMGLVLAADGRVVASRTSLGGNKKNLALRFADGSKVAAEVGYEDAARDLVLLVPAKAGWSRGLPPAAALPAEGASLGGFELRGSAPVRKALHTKSPAGAAGALLDVSGPQFLGSPVVDPTGQAVGLVVYACDAGAPKACKPETRLATVPVLRSFLQALPPTAVIPTAYLGVRGERAIGAYARGVRVLGVEAGSPAAGANLATGPDGDLLLAVAGAPVTTPEELARALRQHTIGEKVALTLFGRTGYRQADVQLAKAPAGVATATSPAQPRAPDRPATSASDGAPKDFGNPR